MPGIPTEHLAEQIEATNRRLADEVHSLGGRIDQAEQRLGDRIGHAERRLDDFRVEVATELGKINATLESIRSRVESAVSVSRWAIGLVIPLVITLVGTAFWLTWHAAKLDSRVERVEKAVGAVERPGAVRK